MLQSIQNRVKAVRAQFVKYHATKVIEQELRLAHAQELASADITEWGVIRDRQAKEIAAVRDGNLPTVDRRSWQWPYLPSSIARIRQPIVKATPYNIRRFMKTPVPRRALNLIKNSVISLDWDIVPMEGTLESATRDVKERCAAAKRCFEKPNLSDSYQSFMETGLDDFLTFGAFVTEPQITPDPKRPIKMWVVDSSTIRMFPTWRESDLDEPHYAQMTGLKGERGIIVFYDDELLYLKDNPIVDSPFGVGKGEIAFQSINALVGVQEMAGRAGADQTHRTWLWWEAAPVQNQIELVRRHITNDLEGQSKINLMSGMKAPQTIEITPTTEQDLLLNWQEMLIRMVANGFDLSPLALGIERDVNRSTGEVLDDKDFRSAVVPVATKLQEGFTRFILHRKLGWTDIKFAYQNLDDPDTMTKMTIQSQMYTTNAQTPNGIREAMGYPKLQTPWADLTQIEAAVQYLKVQSDVQDQNAQKTFNRQQTAQQQQMEQYQQMYEQGQGGQDEDSQGGQQQQAAGVTMPGVKMPHLSPAPKAPMSPKPKPVRPAMAPTAPKIGKVGMSGAQLAGMTPQQLKAAQDSGLAPAGAQDIKDQIGESLLLSISQELRQYLDMLEEEQEKGKRQTHPEPSAEDMKKQKKKFLENQHKQSLIERTVYNTDKDGIPKTKKGQGNASLGNGKEVPNFISDQRVSRQRPSRRKGNKFDG